MKDAKIKGIVSRIESKDYYLFPENGSGEVRCTLRGRFKKEFNLKKDKLYKTDIAVVGDYVDFDMNEDGSGVVTKIEERNNYLSRKAPKIKGAGFRGERLEQVVAANIDNMFIVSCTAGPDFNNKVVDRFIVTGESAHINVFIIINKIDLDSENIMHEWKNLYSGIGYKVFLTSAENGEGLDALKEQLQGNKNLFWGQSGVGKSSLFNRMFPELKLKVGEISSYTDKGTHTTVTSVMINVSDDTYIIDTPGIREIDPFGIRKEDLGHYFLEFGEYINECRFNTCTHHHEPGCAVIDAVESGVISLERYDSYLRLLETVEQDIRF